MKLKYVTFTGIDAWTDLDRLERIQECYPYAEFGILASFNYERNGPRFPESDVFRALKGRKLNLSLHLCKDLGVKSIYMNFAPMVKFFDFLGDTVNQFKRIQLNVIPGDSGSFRLLKKLTLPWNAQQIIVQMYNATYFKRHFSYGFHNDYVSYLLDAPSDGDIDTPIDIVTKEGVVLGYAGGIGPENVEEKLRVLLEHPGNDTFWIDMESKVRTDERFDLDKIEKVLEICDKLITR